MLLIKRIPADDRMWLMAELRDLLTEKTSETVLFPVLDMENAPKIDEADLPAEASLLIHTSGSSGVAKTVALSRRAIEASASATNEALGGEGQWLVALPTHLISGLQMLTRSVLAKTDPIFYDGGFKPKRFIERARSMTYERRYTSLVPAQLAKLMDYASHDPQALAVVQRFDAILVGGQATPVDMRQRAHELGIKVVRTYGMTETAGGCVYDGVEIGSAGVRIREQEVQISGDMLALEYVGSDDLTATHFIFEDDERWFKTGDLGRLRGGMLEITGRKDRVIVSGGVNVSLDEVERVAQTVSGFRGSVAVPINDAEWGAAIAVVREDPSAESLSLESRNDELANKVTDALGKAAVPKKFYSVASIPRLPGDKPDLQMLRAKVLEDMKSREKKFEEP